MSERRRIRCAIYTRKSSEEGLEQDFNSLDAQREACQAYVTSQKHEGWTASADRYDDGGFSGGNMQRPGLVRLLDDVRAKRIDVIVVYKVDRLTRSLADFAKIVEVLDAQGISFVSVTQQFNTTTSMGRLTLNVLLSFAQFEREIAGERIRDKFAASRRKGMWMGGSVPLGYNVENRALVVDEVEAAKVRLIYERYLALGSVRELSLDLDRRGIRSHRRTTQSGKVIGGALISRGSLYLMLQNPVYIGIAVHKGRQHRGLHRSIIEQSVWDRVQVKLAKNRVEHRQQDRARVPSLLAGLVFDRAGQRFTAAHTRRANVRYRYYVRQAEGGCWRIPANELDSAVLATLRSFFTNESELYALLRLSELSPAAVDAVLKNGVAIAALLDASDQAQLRATLHRHITRVQVDDGKLTITVGVDRLREALNLKPLSSGSEHKISAELSFARRGVEQRLVLGDGAAKQRDDALIKAVARAHVWFEDMRTGRVTDISEIANQERLPRSYVQAHMQLAFLAPKIINRILEGTQPTGLTLKQLMSRTGLPTCWTTQSQHLGFNEPSGTVTVPARRP